MFRDGQLLVSEPIRSGDQAFACYHELEPFRDAEPGQYRIVVRYAGRAIAEGAFTVVP